jgi:hypothetical protein
MRVYLASSILNIGQPAAAAAGAAAVGAQNQTHGASRPSILL